MLPVPAREASEKAALWGFTRRCPSTRQERQRWQCTPRLSKFRRARRVDCKPQKMKNLPRSCFKQHSQNLPKGRSVWPGLLSRGPHPDHGVVAVPPTRQLGHGHRVVSAGGRPAAASVYFCVCSPIRPTGLAFPRQGGKSRTMFGSHADVGAPSESSDELVLCNASLKFVRGAAII